MKVLIIQQKMIGDVLTSSILFEALRHEYPNAQLDYLINSHTSPVVENNPYIDNFQYFIPEIEGDSILFFHFLKHIRKKKYDVVIDVYGKWSSNFITFFSKANTRISYYKWYTKLFYTIPIKRLKKPKSGKGLAIENRLQLLEPLCKNIPDLKPKIYLTPKEIETAEQFLIKFKVDLSAPIFMISVLGSGKDKTYPLTYMSGLIDFIVKTSNGQVLFNYIPSQIEEAKTILNCCKPETQSRIHFNVFGRSLREFMALTHHCSALIGNEGGAINMAKALSVPTFAVFSPWIGKETWNIFEDGKTNVSVHLKDYQPELFQDKTNKQVRKEVEKYYAAFKPELFKKDLKRFLKQLPDKA